MRLKGVTAGAYEIEVLGAVRRYVLLVRAGCTRPQFRPSLTCTAADLGQRSMWRLPQRDRSLCLINQRWALSIPDIETNFRDTATWGEPACKRAWGGV
jgi:hypothetical protein